MQVSVLRVCNAAAAAQLTSAGACIRGLGPPHLDFMLLGLIVGGGARLLALENDVLLSVGHLDHGCFGARGNASTCATGA